MPDDEAVLPNPGNGVSWNDGRGSVCISEWPPLLDEEAIAADKLRARFSLRTSALGSKILTARRMVTNEKER